MLEKLLTPFTTATAGGVALRDLVTGIGAVIAMLGVLGFLTPEQQAELTRQSPILLTALGTLIYGGMSIYRSLVKSSSDKAAAVAKAVDADLPAASAVEIVTPGNLPNIIVPAKPIGS